MWFVGRCLTVGQFPSTPAPPTNPTPVNSTSSVPPLVSNTAPTALEPSILDYHTMIPLLQNTAPIPGFPADSDVVVPEQPTISAPFNIKREIEKWKEDNPHMNLGVTAVLEDQYRADLYIILGDETCNFQVLFDDEWHPIVCPLFFTIYLILFRWSTQITHCWRAWLPMPTFYFKKNNKHIVTPPLSS